MHGLLTSRWAEVRTGLLSAADRFSDDDLSFRPAPGGYSVAETLLHIANEEDGEIRFGMTRELPEFPSAFDVQLYQDKTAIIEVLGEVHRRSLSYLQELSESDLSGEIRTPWGATHSRIEMLWHVIEHEIHHRGELSLMLGLLGRQGLEA